MCREIDPRNSFWRRKILFLDVCQHWGTYVPTRKHLTGFLNQPTSNSAHHVKNSVHFTQILDNLQVQTGDLMVSFDVVSLFTKVPVED